MDNFVYLKNKYEILGFVEKDILLDYKYIFIYDLEYLVFLL